MSKIDNKIIEHFNKSKEFIIAVDHALQSNKEFAEQIRHGTFSSSTAIKGTPRLYMTQMKEFELFNQYSKQENSPKIHYALAIASLIQKPGLLQPVSAPEINLKDLPITAVGTHDPSNLASFWNNYNSLNQENKSQVNERLLAVLDMQEAALQNLKFHLGSKNAWTQTFGLQQALMEINRQIELITTGQATPQKACKDLKTHVDAQKSVFEDMRKDDKGKAPLFSSALSHLRHKMSGATKAMAHSAHSFFSKRTPASTTPTFVSYRQRSEEETARSENESNPTLLTLSR